MAETQMPDTLRQQFPSNSYMTKPEDSDKASKKLKKVANGTRKKSIGRKFADVFLGTDIQDIKSFLIWDCLIPGVKFALLDSILMLFGERGYRGGYSGPSSRVPINTMNTSRTNYSGLTSLGRGAPVEPANAQIQRQRYSVDDVMFSSKAEAEEVIDTMVDIIADYGEVSVHDLYDLAGLTGSTFADNYWGWRDLSMATSRHTRDGWILVLPKVMSLR